MDFGGSWLSTENALKVEGVEGVLFGRIREFRLFLIVFGWFYVFEVLVLNFSAYDWRTFYPPISFGVLAIVVSIAFFQSIPEWPGTKIVRSDFEMLELIRAVDKAWERSDASYYVRLLVLLEPFAIIAIPVVYFAFLVSFISQSPNDKISTTIALVALLIAVGSMGLQMVSDQVSARIQEITEGVMFKKVGKSYSSEYLPIVRAVVRRRSRTSLKVKLEDLFDLDSTLFNKHDLLELLAE